MASISEISVILVKDMCGELRRLIAEAKLETGTSQFEKQSQLALAAIELALAAVEALQRYKRMAEHIAQLEAALREVVAYSPDDESYAMKRIARVALAAGKEPY